MPERLDRVTIALNGGDVALSWASRDALMKRLHEIHESRQIRLSFTAVGASRPVALNPAQRAELLVILDDWLQNLPPDLQELRDALSADHLGRE